MEPLEFDDATIIKLFGTEAAEDEDFTRLKSYYLKNKTHKNLMADIPIRILVGHKGIGKSAIFQMAQHEDEESNRISIIIHPDDIDKFGKDGSDFSQMIRDWKDGLLYIIGSKLLTEFHLQDAKYGLEKAINEGGKILNFFIDLFAKKLNENVDQIIARKALIDQFLKNKQIVVYIDDLDRGWGKRTNDIQRISALLNAIRDLCNDNKGLKICLSLRADVYYLVRTSDESTDKIEGYVIWHSWNNQDILLILIKRIEAFFGRDFDTNTNKDARQASLATFLKPIFEDRFEGRGKWENAPIYQVLMSLIRKRPRDLVKLCSLAARDAFEHDGHKISTSNLQAIFSEYSQGRMQDTINEYRSELPEIERLIMNMKPSQAERKSGKGWIYTTPELYKKISNIMEQGIFKFNNGRLATKEDLAQFLYKINFLTARKNLEGGVIQRYYFEEKQYLAPKNANFGYDWEIHPAFRWALAPDDSINPQFEIDLTKE